MSVGVILSLDFKNEISFYTKQLHLVGSATLPLCKLKNSAKKLFLAISLISLLSSL